MKSLLSLGNGAHKEAVVIGLGNPGAEYGNTRHNVGCRAVRYYAKRHGMITKTSPRLFAEAGEGRVGGATVSVVLPLTYMNRSGVAVAASLKQFQLPLERVVVVVDDVYLPLGTLRLKRRGGSGGHNGLRSIEELLGSSNYSRLRLGVGEPPKGEPLADYVLGRFSPAEEAVLPEMLEKAASVLDCWVLQGMQEAMRAANRVCDE